MGQTQISRDQKNSAAPSKSIERPGTNPILAKQRARKPFASGSGAPDVDFPRPPPEALRGLDVTAFLAQAGLGRVILEFRKKQSIFSQGDAAEAIFFIQRGKIRVSVVSRGGKEATIALLGEGSFLGEECIAGNQPSRLTTATAITECALFKINKREMLSALAERPALSDIFVTYLLSRNRRVQEDLVDQLFNSSEKRLARALLMLAKFDDGGATEAMIPRISQEKLAEMIGTTRSRVSFFMSRFHKQGFIEYKGKLIVHSSLLNVILHD